MQRKGQNPSIKVSHKITLDEASASTDIEKERHAVSSPTSMAGSRTTDDAGKVGMSDKFEDMHCLDMALSHILISQVEKKSARMSYGKKKTCTNFGHGVAFFRALVIEGRIRQE